jgi:hypothetical protein
MEFRTDPMVPPDEVRIRQCGRTIGRIIGLTPNKELTRAARDDESGRDASRRRGSAQGSAATTTTKEK